MSCCYGVATGFQSIYLVVCCTCGFGEVSLDGGLLLLWCCPGVLYQTVRLIVYALLLDLVGILIVKSKEN